MNEPEKIALEKAYTGPAIDIAIRIGVIALLIALCFKILRPFITPVVWGTILAIALYPANLTRPPNKPLSLLQAGYKAIARMVPHTTGVMKGRNILKHSAIRRAITPIRIAISIAGLVYAFSMATFSGSFIRIPPVDGGKNTFISFLFD